MWLKQIRDAVLIALAWGLAWLPLGLLLGFIVDRDGSMDEPWVAVGTYPGLLCGLLFVGLLRLTQRGRPLNDLSLPGAVALGAISGLLVSLGAMSLGTPSTQFAVWQALVAVVACITLLSAISAVGSALVARTTKRRHLSTP